jgi:hypothetical protein
MKLSGQRTLESDLSNRGRLTILLMHQEAAFVSFQLSFVCLFFESGICGVGGRIRGWCWSPEVVYPRSVRYD